MVKKNEKKVDRVLGVGCLLVNFFFWPGLGTLIAGRTRIGIIQMVMFLFGLSISFIVAAEVFWFMIGIPIYFDYVGTLMTIAAWVWGVISGIKIIKVGYNPKIRNKFLIKHYVKIIVIVAILLLSIGIYLYISSKSQDITKMSIQIISQNLMNQDFVNKNGVNRINSILDQKFKQLKCSEAETIGMLYNPYFPNTCNFVQVWHYVGAKTSLGMKPEILKNGELLSLLNRTYEKYKPIYVNADKLDPYNNNKWNHIMNAMISLDLLDSKEKDFWVLHYASLKFDENQPKFPQSWNRIWLLQNLGVDSVYTLASKHNLSLSQYNENICSYVPSLDDAHNENLFMDSDKVMFLEYSSIKHFCDIPFTDKDKHEADSLGVALGTILY